MADLTDSFLSPSNNRNVTSLTQLPVQLKGKKLTYLHKSDWPRSATRLELPTKNSEIHKQPEAKQKIFTKIPGYPYPTHMMVSPKYREVRRFEAVVASF
ncbi:hypothetical protein TWF225_004432 [Orbilia oligospora]|uniref:Uncharacterized protein n=1 Tax=Orbilia oligospora TaxID=2813651 RepID=A0A8H2DMV1_ORBOL|nr:hypothetical protein TWF225_004432 [Orbilia oligospora]TGJ63041.1 hypothetical protein EYR41_010991 [Orbilia oligospora]